MRVDGAAGCGSSHGWYALQKQETPLDVSSSLTQEERTIMTLWHALLIVFLAAVCSFLIVNLLLVVLLVTLLLLSYMRVSFPLFTFCIHTPRAPSVSIPSLPFNIHRLQHIRHLHYLHHLRFSPFKLPPHCNSPSCSRHHGPSLLSNALTRICPSRRRDVGVSPFITKLTKRHSRIILAANHTITSAPVRLSASSYLIHNVFPPSLLSSVLPLLAGFPADSHDSFPPVLVGHFLLKHNPTIQIRYRDNHSSSPRFYLSLKHLKRHRDAKN